MFFEKFTAHNKSWKLDSELICTVDEIVRYIAPTSSDERAIAILDRFLKTPDLLCLPVLKNGRVCGLLNRHRFMENHMVGKFGFGHSLNYYKTAGDLMETSFLLVDAKAPLEQVAKQIQSRSPERLYDDVCITVDDRYRGIVTVSDILNAVMENNLLLAVGANPLSGLPGNDYIQRKIRELLDINIDFDICYLDIDSFKPYNDKHGFAKGDEVIKAVADIMVSQLLQLNNTRVSFAGHIGGDDFILLAPPEESVKICNGIIRDFENKLKSFHGKAEVADGCYLSKNRKGEQECFPLLSLSIAIVSTQNNHISSFAEISSIATGLKKKAKSRKGSVVVRDQRIAKN